MVSTWYNITVESLISIWQGFVEFIPSLVATVIVLVIGWFIAIGIGRLVSEILNRLNFNAFFEKSSWKDAIQKADLKVDVAKFVGSIFKWIIFIVFLLIAVEILGLPQFAEFLRMVLSYLPNVIVAVLIFIVAVIVVDILEKIIVASVGRVKIGYAQFTGVIVRWAIYIFAFLAILIQLGIAKELLQILFTGAVALVVISAGIAFGLGGKDVAAEILRDLRDKTKEERTE